MERPVSVTIFGILNIGFGVIGLAGSLVSRSFETHATTTPNAFLNSVIGFLTTLYGDPTYVLWRKVALPVEGGACAVLLAAGIGLLLSKNWARLTSLGYAIYKILFTFLNVIVLFLALHGSLSKALVNVPGWAVAAFIGLAAAGLILTLVYPVLLLFFLTRPRVVESLRTPGGQDPGCGPI